MFEARKIVVLRPIKAEITPTISNLRPCEKFKLDVDWVLPRLDFRPVFVDWLDPERFLEAVLGFFLWAINFFYLVNLLSVEHLISCLQVVKTPAGLPKNITILFPDYSTNGLIIFLAWVCLIGFLKYWRS